MLAPIGPPDPAGACFKGASRLLISEPRHWMRLIPRKPRRSNPRQVEIGCLKLEAYCPHKEVGGDSNEHSKQAPNQ
jgi:hypothetical protein